LRVVKPQFIMSLHPPITERDTQPCEVNMSILQPSPFAEDLKRSLAQKRSHLAAFRLWRQIGGSDDFVSLLDGLIARTDQMIDLLIEALKREGEPIPDVEPDPSFIAEARGRPNARARAQFAEQILRRSMVEFEQKLSATREKEQRDLWNSLFDLEAENWAAVEDYLNP